MDIKSTSTSEVAILPTQTKRLLLASRIVPALAVAIVVVTLSLSISVATNDRNAIKNGGFDGYDTTSMANTDLAVIVLASFAIALIISTFILNMISNRKLEQAAKWAT